MLLLGSMPGRSSAEHTVSSWQCPGGLELGARVEIQEGSRRRSDTATHTAVISRGRTRFGPWWESPIMAATFLQRKTRKIPTSKLRLFDI